MPDASRPIEADLPPAEAAFSVSQGESPVDRPRTSSCTDLGVYRQAIANEWPITRDMRSRIIQDAMAVLDDPDAGGREKAAARKLLLQADKINATRESAVMRSQAAAQATTAVQVNVNNQVGVAVGEPAAPAFDPSKLTLEQLEQLHRLVEQGRPAEEG